MDKETQAKEFFEFLSRYIGRKVTIIYSVHGQMHTKRGRLAGIDDFKSVFIQMELIPFVGYGSAIYQILDWEGKVLYWNKNLEPHYNRTTKEEVDEARREIFGNIDIEENHKIR